MKYKDETERVESHAKQQGVKPTPSKFFRQGMDREGAKYSLKRAMAKKMKSKSNAPHAIRDLKVGDRYSGVRKLARENGKSEGEIRRAIHMAKGKQDSMVKVYVKDKDGKTNKVKISSFMGHQNPHGLK